jgi:hypothetical protein
MKISVVRTCSNCDFYHSGCCDMGMRKLRTIGQCKNGKGKYCVCNYFQVYGTKAGDAP